MSTRTLSPPLLLLVLAACSGTDDNTANDEAAGSGGDSVFTTTGGSTSATGGVDGSTGGSLATGGESTSGGSAADGGSTGGFPATGGQVATGGMDATGGDGGSGGTATGGVPGTGGVDGSGGDGTGGSENPMPKFVGNITTRTQVDAAGLTYSDYWDQITPENAGKWGSVQSTPSSPFNWNTLDAIYDYTEDHGIIFKQHAFVWGAQQPNGVPTQQQVIAWIDAFCSRYPNTALIDVVNEPPPHTEPNYSNNIGGGTNGDWAWIANAFRWARESCPGAILILNDYNNIEWGGDNQHFIDIVNTIVGDGAPVDAVGAQAHDLDHASINAQNVSNLLNKLHEDTGLPVYITEMDLSYSDEQQQLSAYQTYFPMFWDASFVHGITIWGWIYGATWDLSPNSGIVNSNGSSRQAMTWLMGELGRPAP